MYEPKRFFDSGYLNENYPCCEQSPDLIYFCTRDKGHTGLHEATIRNHIAVKRW